MTKYITLFIKLSFLGVGLGIILGSSLNMIINKNNLAQKNQPTIHIPLDKNNKGRGINRFNLLNLFRKLPKRQNNKATQIIALSEKWNSIAKKNTDFKISGYLVFLDKKGYAELNPNFQLPSASTIKISILIILLNMLDEGKITWNEDLTLSKDDIGGGSGWMAYQKTGTTFPIYEIATEMIRVSDNTATNILIRRIGGKSIANARLKKFGLKNTYINNLLPDLKGTNLTSTKDLVNLISMVDTENLLSKRSRDIFRQIMSTSKTNSLIPQGILQGLGNNSGDSDIDYSLFVNGYVVYNKTGDIGISYGDAGLIQMPDTTRAVAAFMVQGSYNNPRSPEIIREMSKEMIPFLTEN